MSHFSFAFWRRDFARRPRFRQKPGTAFFCFSRLKTARFLAIRWCTKNCRIQLLIFDLIWRLEESIEKIHVRAELPRDALSTFLTQSALRLHIVTNDGFLEDVGMQLIYWLIDVMEGLVPLITIGMEG